MGARGRTLGSGILLLVVIAAVGVACQRTRPIGDTTPARAPDTAAPEVSLATSGTDMVLHPGAPVVAGRNVLWCAATQLAWDAFGEAFASNGAPSRDLRLGPPAPPALVAAMNRHDFPHGDLDPTSYVVEAGLVGAGLVARFERRMAALGRSFPLALDRLDPEGIAALVYLFKDLPFEQPFLVHEEPLHFAGSATPLASFGTDHAAQGAAHPRMLRQLRLHDGDAGPDGSPNTDDDVFAVTLMPRTGGDRIVLGHIAPPATLDAGWTTTAALLARPETSIPRETTLKVPKVDFATTHEFSEVVGARLLDAPAVRPPPRIVGFRQRLEFRLSEEGARLVAAVAVASNSVGISGPMLQRRLEFDRPFLLALIRDGATRPYFLAWFGNDRLFVRR